MRTKKISDSRRLELLEFGPTAHSCALAGTSMGSAPSQQTSAPSRPLRRVVLTHVQFRPTAHSCALRGLFAQKQVDGLKTQVILGTRPLLTDEWKPGANPALKECRNALAQVDEPGSCTKKPASPGSSSPSVTLTLAPDPVLDLGQDSRWRTTRGTASMSLTMRIAIWANTCGFSAKSQRISVLSNDTRS